MIARISGKIIERGKNHLLLNNGGLTYEVFLPLTCMQRLDESISGDGVINLVTYHYFQVEPSRSIPVLIGFLNEIEKEFFECFITVSGIGPRGALRALNQPISSIAHAIDTGDLNFLRSLPKTFISMGLEEVLPIMDMEAISTNCILPSLSSGKYWRHCSKISWSEMFR